MGRAVLVFRLAGRNLRRRPVEVALLVLAIMAATTMLTLGLALQGVTDDPYARTRQATSGADVVASAGPLVDLANKADLASWRDAAGVDYRPFASLADVTDELRCW